MVCEGTTYLIASKKPLCRASWNVRNLKLRDGEQGNLSVDRMLSDTSAQI